MSYCPFCTELAGIEAGTAYLVEVVGGYRMKCATCGACGPRDIDKVQAQSRWDDAVDSIAFWYDMGLVN